MGRPAPYILNSTVATMASKKEQNGQEQPSQGDGSWTIGLINSKHKYLSAETFGFKVNANGKTMRKKQVWTLEPSGDGDTICLRSHLNKFLAVDQFGNVTCESEDKNDKSAKFEISVCNDSSGRWAFKSVSRGYFLGATSEKLVCSAKIAEDPELWFANLAVRPHVNLRSAGRKRYARLSEDQTQIQVEENVPWGSETLFTLEFQEESNKYSVSSINNMYLMRDGGLVPELSSDCLYTCEYHGGYIALKDNQGLYLSPIGSRAILKTKSNVVTKDELFSLENALPQISLQAVSNQRFVSIKQGVDVIANQEKISLHETFQLEFDHSASMWRIRSTQDNYISLETGGHLQTTDSRPNNGALFDLVWQEYGTVALKAENGKYVSTKKSGHLVCNVDTIEDRSENYLFLINRPMLVLKCEQGFVGYQAPGNQKLECNKVNYANIIVEQGEQGKVFFKGQNEKYWEVRNGGVVCDSDQPNDFYMELREPSRMCIKTCDGKYLMEQKNGGFSFRETNPEEATKWEY